jgi:SHS2 domain-containing protein
MRYRLLEHTADLMVAVYGKDLPELFCNAAFMLFDIMVDIKQVEPKLNEPVELKSIDLEELFLDWLRELLYRFSTRGFVPNRVAIEHLNPGSLELKAQLTGEVYQPDKHGLKIEIKTPTYHNYRLEQTATGWIATVVLDV